MTTWLAGMRITAERLNDHTLEDSTTSGVVDEAGWNTTGFQGRRVNGITTLRLFVNRTGASIAENPAGSGNVTDISMCTLPAGWRPPETLPAIWGNGSNDGEARILTSGVVEIRSCSGSSGIASGSNVSLYTSWISEND